MIIRIFSIFLFSFSVLSLYDLFDNNDSAKVSEHEVITLLRKAGNSSLVKYADIVQEIIEPSNKIY